jgi:hypothetical protein
VLEGANKVYLGRSVLKSCIILRHESVQQGASVALIIAACLQLANHRCFRSPIGSSKFNSTGRCKFAGHFLRYFRHSIAYSHRLTHAFHFYISNILERVAVPPYFFTCRDISTRKFVIEASQLKALEEFIRAAISTIF